MARSAVVLLLIVAIAYSSAFPQDLEASKSCGPNEEYTTCGSSCGQVCGEEESICTMNCVIGCQCVDGYKRNAGNQCVLTRDC